MQGEKDLAVADKTIDPRILSSARKEFLEKGFEKASCKDICMHAGVTTGALYKRYAGKEELFTAVVQHTVEDLNRIVEEKSRMSPEGLTDQQLIDAWYMDEDYMLWWFDYLYQRYDDFVLLLSGSAGSGYWNFAHSWVEKMNQATYAYYEEAYRRGIVKIFVSKEEMHVLITSFWSGIYEPFIHGMDWEQIKNHCKIVCRFFDWHGALQFGPPGEKE